MSGSVVRAVVCNASLFDVFEAVNVATTLGVWQNGRGKSNDNHRLDELNPRDDANQGAGPMALKFNWNPSPFVLYSSGPASVMVGPSLRFEATFDFTLSTYKGAVRELALCWNGRVQTELSAVAALAAKGDLSFSKAIYSQALAGFAFWIGFIPFWIQPSMDIVAGINLHADDTMKFDSSVGLQSTVSMRAHWTPADRMKTAVEYSQTPIVKNPAFSAGCSATVDVYVTPSFRIQLNDIVTMSAEMGPHLRMDYNAPPPSDVASLCPCNAGSQGNGNETAMLTRNAYMATSLGIAGSVGWDVRGYSGIDLRADLFNDQLDLTRQCVPAPSACQASSCNTCPLHCKACIVGTTCYDCITGWYGMDCNIPCPPNCEQDNYCGNACRVCKPGFWGKNCMMACSAHCVDPRFCGQTGECDCAPGYWGTNCKNACNPQQHCYGTCDRQTGRCHICDYWWCDDCFTPCPNSTSLLH